MSTEKAASPTFELPRLDLPETVRRRLPTMLDLPSNDPEDPGLPDKYHQLQPQLLDETFMPPEWPADQLFTAADLYLYYDPDHPRWYKRPDWFAVLGVPRAHPKDPLRWSYVTWEERILPYVVVELVSHTDPDPDQGEPPESAEEKDKPPSKWAVYERSLGIPFYLIYDRFKDELHCHTLEGGRYRDTTPTDRRVWLPAAGLGIGVWEGTFKGAQLTWLRGFDAAGQWLPTGEERELRQRRQIERANRRAELQSRRAELESRRAENENRRAEKLAAKLRALGIDPDA